MLLSFLLPRPPPRPTLFPYTTLFRSIYIRAGPAAPDSRHSSNGSPCTLRALQIPGTHPSRCVARSEEHTSELQSLTNLVCRLLLEKKKRRDGLAGRGAESSRSAAPLR